MKSNAKNSFNYTGIVTLSRYSRGKKFVLMQSHNTGKLPLFDFFAYCLMSDFKKASSLLPNKIQLFKDEGTDKTSGESECSGFIYLQTNPERVNSTNQGIVRYSFIVPRTALSANFNRIGLYPAAATDIAEYSAICEIDEEITTASMSASSVLVVDWELIISN